MAAQSTGNWAQTLWPGIKAWYGQAYAQYPDVYSQIFQVETSTKALEKIQGVSGFGLFPIKTEGNSFVYDRSEQAFTSTFTHVVYGSGFVITREVHEDDQYGIVGKQQSTGLARAGKITRETVCANVLNRAFTSGYTGGDGSILCVTTHPYKAGGTWANTFSTAADLSEAALEQACVNIARLKDDRQLPMLARPRKLAIPPDLDFEAERILKSVLQNDTSNNAINALRSMGKIPQGVVSNVYLTDTDAWFVLTDVPYGLIYFQRRPDEFNPMPENDFDTENAKYKASIRMSVGWADPRGAYGSAGA